MYNDKLEKLIEMALMDGELTEKEKQILFKKAESFGVDLDEFEMVLDAKLFEKQQSNKSEATATTASPKSDKFGDVKKCPACGAMVQSFQTKCGDCGHEFRNVEASQNIIKFFEKLDEIESKRTDGLFERSEKNSSVSFGTMLKWLFFWWILLPIKIISFLFNKTKPVKWSTTDARKEEIIMNFPVPNSREEIIEFMTLSVSKLKKISIFQWLDEEGKYLSKWNKIWIKKVDQVFAKAKLSMKDDKTTLQEVGQMVGDSQNMVRKNDRTVNILIITTISLIVIGIASLFII